MSTGDRACLIASPTHVARQAMCSPHFTSVSQRLCSFCELTGEEHLDNPPKNDGYHIPVQVANFTHWQTAFAFPETLRYLYNIACHDKSSSFQINIGAKLTRGRRHLLMTRTFLFTFTMERTPAWERSQVLRQMSKTLNSLCIFSLKYCGFQINFLIASDILCTWILGLYYPNL
jgi:hypothetical protein